MSKNTSEFGFFLSVLLFVFAGGNGDVRNDVQTYSTLLSLNETLFTFNTTFLEHYFNDYMRNTYNSDWRIAGIKLQQPTFDEQFMYDAETLPGECLMALEKSWILPSDCHLPVHCGTPKYINVDTSWWGRQWGYCAPVLDCNDTKTIFKYCTPLKQHIRVYIPINSYVVTPVHFTNKENGHEMVFRLHYTFLPYFIRDTKFCLYSDYCGLRPDPIKHNDQLCYEYSYTCNYCFDSYEQLMASMTTIKLSRYYVAGNVCKCEDPFHIYHDVVICVDEPGCYLFKSFDRGVARICTSLEAVASNPFALIGRSIVYMLFSIIKEVWYIVFRSMTVLLKPWLEFAPGFYMHIINYMYYKTLVFEMVILFCAIYHYQRDMYWTMMVVLPTFVYLSYYFY